MTVFNLPRLSVDIDLDFAKALSKEEMKEHREWINSVLKRYMTAEGYTIQNKSKHTHALDSYVFSYNNAAGNPDNIKIEINYLLRFHAFPTIDAIVQIPDIISAIPIRTLAPIEIFASKIVALLNRAAARDLFDIENMVNSRLFNASELVLLRKCAVLYLAIAGEVGATEFDLSKLSDITERRIKTDLNPMIRNRQRFDLASTKQHVEEFLAELLILTEEEAFFLQRFNDGCYEPCLIFEDKEILNRIENHPMAIWRTRRIKEIGGTYI